MTELNNIPGQNEYSDLLFAYAVGCLDKQDLLELNEFFQTGNEFPWQELGEYQNLTALLPAILNMETPGPEIKDKVARKLYRIKNEKYTKKNSGVIPKNKDVSEINQNITAPGKAELSDFLEHSRSLNEKENQKIDDAPKNNQELPADTSQILENTGEELFFQKTPGSEITGHSNFTKEDEIDTIGTGVVEMSAIQNEKAVTSESKPYHLHGIPESDTEKKSKSGVILLLILFIIVISGFLYLYRTISSRVDTYKAGIESLNEKVSNLTEQVSINREIQKILQMKDSHIINLYGSSINKEGYGKVIFSFESNKGFLQVSNLSTLDNTKTYQLWMVNDGNSITLSTFKPVDTLNYFPISIPVQNYKGAIRFIVTGESSKGSSVSPGKVYLTGILQ
jgi:anti-sigma-K factor RskA